jgi:hypothetical protein
MGVSKELLWKRHEDSSGIQTKKNFCRWKPSSEDWGRQCKLKRRSVFHSELWTVQINELVLLLVVASCKSTISPITNSYQVYSHSNT